MAAAIVDTSFIVAMFNKNDKYYQACQDAYHKQAQVIFLLQPALSEIAYMLRRYSPYNTVITFFNGISQSKFQLIEVNESDLLRAAAIMGQYADAELDFVDAAIVAVAERLSIQDIFTLDQRDFSIIRPKHCDYFRLTPA
ncbi:MAG: twitching motility protein PilT [Anaerolineaceae bacterium]|nr:twitching motility protein PilT [Anaerolineaceae bacterium]